MKPWHLANHELYRREVDLLSERYPSLSVLEVGERVVIEGVYELIHDGQGVSKFDIRILVPQNYPVGIPDLYIPVSRIRPSLERHTLEGGLACLCVPGDHRKYWPAGCTLCDFIASLVHPFLVWQAYYETSGEPPWPGRGHGAAGLVEWYQEELGISNLQSILGFIELLAKKDAAKGHIRCPCGSEKRLRDCHREKYTKLRTLITPEAALLTAEMIAKELAKH